MPALLPLPLPEEVVDDLRGDQVRRILVKSRCIVLLLASQRMLCLTPPSDTLRCWRVSAFDTFLHVVDVFIDESQRHLCFTTQESTLHHVALHAKDSSPSMVVAMSQPISALAFHSVDHDQLSLLVGTTVGSVHWLQFVSASSVTHSLLLSLDVVAPIGSISLLNHSAAPTLFVLAYTSPMRLFVFHSDASGQLDKGALSSVAVPGDATHGSSFVITPIDADLFGHAILTEEGIVSGVMTREGLLNRYSSHAKVNLKNRTDSPLNIF